jgi:hypothetical protein
MTSHKVTIQEDVIAPPREPCDFQASRTDSERTQYTHRHTHTNTKIR